MRTVVLRNLGELRVMNEFAEAMAVLSTDNWPSDIASQMICLLTEG
jgi:hypothetical protein